MYNLPGPSFESIIKASERARYVSEIDAILQQNEKLLQEMSEKYSYLMAKYEDFSEKHIKKYQNLVMLYLAK